MKITIDVEGRDEQLIRLRAQALGLTPTEVVQDAVEAQQSSRAPFMAHAREIAALVRARWCDADIAAKLGLANGQVAKIRRELRMSPNRRADPRTARPQVTYGGRS